MACFLTAPLGPCLAAGAGSPGLVPVGICEAAPPVPCPGPAGRVAEAGELCEALRCLIAHVLRAACSVSPSLPEAGAACLPDSTEFSVQPANLVHLAPHFLPPAPKHVSRPGGSPGPSTPQASPPGTEVADPTRGRPASRQPLGPLCSVLRSLGQPPWPPSLTPCVLRCLVVPCHSCLV